jgi:stress-induced morphogen
MITAQEIERLLQAALRDARLAVRDLTGTQDHYDLEVVSAVFVGLPLIERHRKVYAALAEPLKGPLHAVTLHTLTPDERASRQGA